MATDIIARGMITEYKSGTNIDFTENEDGSVTISASGDVSSEDTVARDTIDNHKHDKNNPHNVTAEQVGLGNVDNTADLDKPISNATQAELDEKAEKVHTHLVEEITDFPDSLPANGGNADTVNNHTVDSDVPDNAVFTDTTNSDVSAAGNPVQIDGLQGGVPFSEMVVSGKNLMPRKSFESTEINGITFTLNNDGSITVAGSSTDNIFYDFTGKFTIPDGIYYLSGTPSEYLGSDCYLSIRSGTPPIGQKTNFDELDGSMSVISHDDAYCIIRINAGVSFGDGVVFRPQIELGDTATEYEPPITGRELTVNVNGTDYTITPDSNPYTVPNDIRQLDGLNNISVSAGTLSVTGVRKNAAIKRIWDEIDEIKTAIIVSNGESE